MAPKAGLHNSNSRVGDDLDTLDRVRGGHQITSMPLIRPPSAFHCYRLV